MERQIEAVRAQYQFECILKWEKDIHLIDSIYMFAFPVQPYLISPSLDRSYFQQNVKTSQELRMLSSVTLNCQIQIPNCQTCNQCHLSLPLYLSFYLLVRSCLLIILIRCLKCHKLLVVPDQARDTITYCVVVPKLCLGITMLSVSISKRAR